MSTALEQEARKWEYRKLELQYLEAGQHLRSLNQLMWQVPGMAIAITGGLWYGATTIDAEIPRSWVLGFAAVVDVLTIFIIWRLRSLIEIQIGHQRSFEGAENNKDRWKRVVITCWTLALAAAAVVSGAGAVHPSALTKKLPPNKPEPCCNVAINLKTPGPTKGLEQILPPPTRQPPKKRKPCS